MRPDLAWPYWACWGCWHGKRKQQAAAASAFNDSSLEVAPALILCLTAAAANKLLTATPRPAPWRTRQAGWIPMAMWTPSPRPMCTAYGKEDEAIKILAEALHRTVAEHSASSWPGIYAKQQGPAAGGDGARRQGPSQGQGDWERVRTWASTWTLRLVRGNTPPVPLLLLQPPPPVCPGLGTICRDCRARLLWKANCSSRPASKTMTRPTNSLRR